jgi:hypothetical protein
VCLPPCRSLVARLRCCCICVCGVLLSHPRSPSPPMAGPGLEVGQPLLSPRALSVDGALGVLLHGRRGGVGGGMGGQIPAPVKGAMSGEAHSDLGCCCFLWCELMCSGLCWEADPTTPVPSSWPPTPARGFGARNGASGEWVGTYLGSLFATTKNQSTVNLLYGHSLASVLTNGIIRADVIGVLSPSLLPAGIPRTAPSTRAAITLPTAPLTNP